MFTQLGQYTKSGLGMQGNIKSFSTLTWFLVNEFNSFRLLQLMLPSDFLLQKQCGEFLHLFNKLSNRTFRIR